MPIRPTERHRYPADWRAIADRIRARAGYRCESVPGAPPCLAQHGHPHPLTGATVVLTVAHLDHHPEHCADENLRALCQRCHNRYDQTHRQRHAALTRRAQKRNGELFDAEQVKG
jgi:5-methylcytosine-specific restriction endonuclease McrA